MKKSKITIKKKPKVTKQTKNSKPLEFEIVRLSKLVVQKVQETKEIRERLEGLLKEKEERQCFLENEVAQRMKELEEKVQELEQFKRISIGRELKMVSLKEQLRASQEELQKFNKS